MTAVFGEKEKSEAYALKKRMTVGWLISLGAFLLVEGALVAADAVIIASTRSRAPYIPFMLTSILLSCAYFCGTVYFFSTKYKMTSRYCRMLTDMREGLKDHTTGKFIGIDPKISEKDGVYFYSMILDCPPLRRGDITERHVLVERTHSLPDFLPGERIKFVTHANILMAYEIDPYDPTPAGAKQTEDKLQ